MPPAGRSVIRRSTADAEMGYGCGKPRFLLAMQRHERLKYLLEHPLHFVLQVLRGFRANQGFLLAGAVAYYTLLSIVPMFAVILVGLSQLVEPEGIIDTLRDYLLLVAPGQADALLAQITVFLANWKLVGLAGLLVLLFFSSFAFTTLENAMAVIFHHRAALRRRHFLVSAVIPYIYILLLALGLLVVSVVSGGLHALEGRTLTLFGQSWSLGALETVLVYLLGILGEVLLLTSLYMVMPVGRLALHQALIGGVTATLLWEITRHVLVWYFTTLSFVNVIYGAFTTVIVILLSLEAAAMILLLGAQAIAEYERLSAAEDQPNQASRNGR